MTRPGPGVGQKELALSSWKRAEGSRDEKTRCPNPEVLARMHRAGGRWEEVVL